MKFSHLFSIVLLFSGLLLTSCFEEGGICVNADQNQITQDFDLTGFTGLKLATVGHVNLIPGDSLDIKVTGSENIIDLLKMDLNGEVLKIDIDRCTRNTDLVFDITMPVLTSVAISGSGTIIGTDPFDVEDLEVKISGSGDMELEFTATSVETSISGSGDMKLFGTTGALVSHISGSGDVHAFGLSATTAELNINGSGNMEVTVTDQLDARISGSGDIRYKGTPAISVEVSGSGKIEDAN